MRCYDAAMLRSWPVSFVWMVSCGGGLAEPAPWLDVPASVAVDIPLGVPSAVVVDVTNVGTAGGSVDAVVGSPFTLSDARYAVAAGEQVQVSAFVTGERAEVIEGLLELRIGARTWEVALAATVLADLDGDGATSVDAGGDDCDDTDPEVYAGAPERCNGVDDDCDEEIDEGLPAVAAWADADGDGFGDPAAPVADVCALEPGQVGNGDDCDDGDAEAFPGAVEVWYDGLDQACDGGDDFDQDGDGVPRQPEGDDCDDTRADVAPGAVELPDGADNDCDTMRDEDTLVGGELVFVELFTDPDRSDATWLELHNPGVTHADLDLATLWADGTELPLPSLWLGPAEVVLLCDDDDPQTNGGLDCDGVLPLPSGTRHVVLEGPGELVDEVDTQGWSRVDGRSLELGLGALNATLNDDEAAWCVGVSLFGDDSGDRGTPGALLPPC